MQSHSPQPPRRRRRGLLWRAAVVLVLLMLALRLAWGWWVDRRVQAQLDDLRRRGLPVEVSDIAFESVPDAVNAWLVQMQAAGALVPGVDPPRNSLLEYDPCPPYPADWLKLAEASEKAHGAAFRLARQARNLPRADMQQRLTSPLSATMMRSGVGLSMSRDLACVLADGALYMHLVAGDDAEAFERCLDTLHLARSLGSGCLLMDQLMAWGREMMACEMLQIIGSGQRLGTSATTRPASRQQIQQMIGQLLDETGLRAGLQRSVQMERVIWLDAARQAREEAWFIRPLAGTEVLRFNPYMDAALRAAHLANRRTIRAELARAQRETALDDLSGHLRRYSRWYVIGYAKPVDDLFERAYRVLAERRTTAVALACHLYRADHGRWPENLGALVPAYLPALPADPHHEGRPIGYAVLKGKLPDGGDRPVLWFDAGVADYSVEEKPMFGPYVDSNADLSVHLKLGDTKRYEHRQYRDLVRFLPQKSPQAVEDNPREANAPGDKAKQDDQAEQPEGQEPGR